ncbi:G5 and 3D domain-containing protein [Aquibacillus saliphilus]|uniref:G5 and 3D domain-containing protein n=1 Tax=Aquibacillus saliphilus TaxID=1909422 RepID=UPI001CEFE905|nr:G5 and 3D domain-containing protein [Aquibacillus saliphilus]
MRFISKLLPALKTKLVIPILSIIALVAFISFTTYQVTKAQVTVTQDGEVDAVRTHAETVGDVLNELGIKMEDHDELSHPKDELITSGMEINYTKANAVIVSIDGEDKEYYTTEDTVGEFLAEQEIKLSDHDELSVSSDQQIEAGLSIGVTKAYQVTLNDGGKEKQVWVTGGTVEDVLESEDVSLGELDRLKPNKSDEVSKETTINVTRVEKVTDIVEETKKYSVVKKNDNSLAKGTEKVVSSGQEGVIAKHFEVVLENGEEVSRELVKEEVKKESKQRVVSVGTKVNKNTGTRTVSRGDDNVARTLTMHATAYNWNCASCDGVGKTRTGINLKANPNIKVVAVDPSVIPLGTKLWVEGYGYATANDTGGNIKGNRIDVHLPTLSAAQSYGRKTVQVRILE